MRENILEYYAWEHHNNSLLGKTRTAKCFLGNMNILLMQKDA